MPRFNAIVCTGTIHNYDKNVSREGRWMYAREIPLQYLPRYQQHPHSIEGLAWDIDRREWRNLKHAVVHKREILSIEETF